MPILNHQIELIIRRAGIAQESYSWKSLFRNIPSSTFLFVESYCISTLYHSSIALVKVDLRGGVDLLSVVSIISALSSLF